jgi:Family of unknown function (DUF6088)
MSRSDVAAAVREKVLASYDCFWRPGDFSDYSPDAVAAALSRLRRSGELRRVRRGLYWRGTRTPLGMAPPTASDLAGALVPLEGSGPAGRSAALLLGLSTQVPRRESIAVPARPPESTEMLRFVSRAAAAGRRDSSLRPTEVALLEVLRDWEGLVESPADEARRRIAGLMGSGEIRPDRLARASSTEPAPVRERLRGLLGDVGRPEIAATVRPARRQPPSLGLAR